MLQATATLMAEGQGRLLSQSNERRELSSVNSVTSKREYQQSLGYSFLSRLRNRVCSDSCLKFVYLSCATLISASFIIECILLHLIVVPYLSESVFELGVCKINSTGRENDQKKCENKCSKERSSFPCLQVLVKFTPFRFEHNPQTNGNLLSVGAISDNIEVSSTLQTILHRHSYPEFLPPWESQTKYELPPYARYNFSSSETRMVYLYDYFSTFKTHKTSRCSTSPCHRREEDNRNAVDEYERVLWRHHITPCYARPYRRIQTGVPPTTPSPSGGQQSNSAFTLPPLAQPIFEIPNDPKDAAAILYRLYTQSMFLHSLVWPGGIFIGATIVLLFTYLVDGCQAWARDKTVIA